MALRVTATCVQAEIVPGDPAENTRRAREWVAACPRVGDHPHLILFPEYFLQGLVKEGAALAQPLDGDFGQAMTAAARESGATVLAGFLESSPDPSRPYNTIGIWCPGGVIGAYRKTHLYDLGGDHPDWVRECRAFLPGDRLGFFAMAGLKAGVMTCADGLLVEVPRALAVRGADLILYPNGRGQVPPSHAEFHAEANGVPIAVCNGWGSVGAEEMNGGSRVISHHGSRLVTCEAKSGIVTVSLDISEGRAYRASFWPLAARRPELYRVLSGTEEIE